MPDKKARRTTIRENGWWNIVNPLWKDLLLNNQMGSISRSNLNWLWYELKQHEEAERLYGLAKKAVKREGLQILTSSDKGWPKTGEVVPTLEVLQVIMKTGGYSKKVDDLKRNFIGNLDKIGVNRLRKYIWKGGAAGDHWTAIAGSRAVGELLWTKFGQEMQHLQNLNQL